MKCDDSVLTEIGLHSPLSHEISSLQARCEQRAAAWTEDDFAV
jgi:hypothetical protein